MDIEDGRKNRIDSVATYGLDDESVLRIHRVINSIKYPIIRLISCHVPFIPSSTPLIGQKTLIELLIICLLLAVGIHLCLAQSYSAGLFADLAYFFTVLVGLRHNLFAILFNVSFERAVQWHKLIAMVGYTYMIIHAYIEGNDSTGVVLAVFFGCMSMLYFVKIYFFEVFYFCHIALLVCSFPVAIAHGCVYFPIAFGVWVIDLLLRYIVRGKTTRAKFSLLPGNVIKVQFKKCFDYEAGQYVFIRIPEIDNYQYHPISLSSSPHEDITSLHIRALGDWSNQVRDRIINLKNETEMDIALEGPFGISRINHHDTSYTVSFHPILTVNSFLSKI